MARNTYNRTLDKHTNALKVYCDRENMEKAEAALEDVHKALESLMAATRLRTEARKAKDVQRSEAQRPKETAKSEPAIEGSKDDAGPPVFQVPNKKQSKPRNVRKESK